MPPPLPRRARRWVAAALTGLVAVCGASLWWARSRPPFSEAELADATRSVNAVRTRLRQVTCRRPALAGAAGGGRASLAALLDPDGAQGACLRAAAPEDVRDAFHGTVHASDGRSRRWAFDVPEPAHPLPPGDHLVFVFAQHPQYPEGEEPEAYRRVRAACGELAAAVTAHAGGEGGCSPFAPESPGWLDPQPQMLQLARAISVVARGAAGDGDLERALTLLVRGAAVLQDVRRGPTSVVTGMLSLAAETLVWATFNSLLIAEPAPAAPLREKLSLLIDQLIDAWPHPHDMFSAEALAISELTRTVVASDDERGAALMVVGAQARRADGWCPRGGEPTACFSSTPIGGARASEPGIFLQVVHAVAGRPAQVRSEVDAQLEQNELSYRRYYARLLSSEVSMRIIKVMLALSAAREEGICPTSAAVDPRLLAVPFATGPIEISHLDGPQYEVIAPRLMVHPTFERVDFLTTCPRVGGRWEAP